MKYSITTQTGISLAILFALSASALGQEESVRYYEEGGVTYREVKRQVQRPVRDVEYQDREQTLYRDRYDTRMHSVRQYRYAPMRQYYWEPRLHGQWNIFTGPYWGYHLREKTNWQMQTRLAQVPITERKLESTTRTVRMPVPKLSMKQDEVVTRVAVGPAAGRHPVSPNSNATNALAWNIVPQPTFTAAAPTYYPAYSQVATYPTQGWNYGAYGLYGGVARLEGDPPRYGYSGFNAGNAGAWQARRDSNQTR